MYNFADGGTPYFLEDGDFFMSLISQRGPSPRLAFGKGGVTPRFMYLFDEILV